MCLQQRTTAFSNTKEKKNEFCCHRQLQRSRIRICSNPDNEKTNWPRSRTEVRPSDQTTRCISYILTITLVTILSRFFQPRSKIYFFINSFYPIFSSYMWTDSVDYYRHRFVCAYTVFSFSTVTLCIPTFRVFVIFSDLLSPKGESS